MQALVGRKLDWEKVREIRRLHASGVSFGWSVNQSGK